MRTETGQSFRLEDYRHTGFEIPETDLVFRLTPECTQVTATLTILRRADTGKSAPLVLDGDGLSLTGLAIDGLPAHTDDYTATADRLEIRNLPSTDRFTVRIKTNLSPQDNTALMGLYRSNGVYCTQCEAEGFRRITYFLDRPDVLSVYSVRIEARKSETPVMLSNGNPGRTGELEDGWHFAEWHDPHPKPSYLFALVAGELGSISQDFKTASGRPVELRIYVEPGKEDRAGYAMDALVRSMRWDEQEFGREYDLDVFNIVAVSDFNMGAMENKGLNVFNDKYVLADAQTATDADFASIEAIIAHEYFHNWTGNRITCRDWFQLCLKEGLTVYRDHEFSADQRSRAVRRIAEVQALRTNQFPEDRGPLAHPVRPRRYKEINNFYTATVYEKGSEVVRMLRTIVGPANFRAGMDLYFDRFDGTAATIEDFIGCFAETSGMDLSQFFLWYEQAGTPNIAVSRRYDAKKETLALEFEQSVPPTPGQTRKKPMHIPVAYGLVGSDGKDLRHGAVTGAHVEGGVIHLEKRHHKIVFTGVGERPAVSLLRGFSAPVTIDFPQRIDDETFLARHDSDLFARFQALNGLINRDLVLASKAVRGGSGAQFDGQTIALMGEIASDEKLEPAYRGFALSLPGEAEIARNIGDNIDPDSIHAARVLLLQEIAGNNQPLFQAVADAMSETGPFRPDAQSAGRRSLKNTMLEYLASVETSPARFATAYGDAGNMTDRAAALRLLVHWFADEPETRNALADFEDSFRGDAVVLDKWFAIQATAPGRTGYDNVVRLIKHPAFTLRNPNRFRALIGSFAAANHTGFNLASGDGYRLVCKQILAAESLNPQVAARLATAFRSYGSLEANRREKARAALAEISKSSSLSADLRDIVDRLLT